MKKKLQILSNHSEILDYPINFNLYPKMKNINFIEIDLNKNEYLFIPSNWIHWVITEPETIAISFEIRNMKDNNTILCNKFKDNDYYIGKGLDTEFNYKNFMLDNKNKTFKILFSEIDDCSPVIKNNNNKYFKETTLEKAYLESNKKNYYTYVGANDADRNNLIKSINNYINILEEDIFYYKYLWLTLDKKIHSGMHFDSDNKILYVLEGRKKILLLPPSNLNNIYLKNFNLANLITDDNNLSEYDSSGNNIFLKDFNLTNYSITDDNNLSEDYSSKNNIKNESKEKFNKYFYGIIIIIIILILIILWYYIL